MARPAARNRSTRRAPSLVDGECVLPSPPPTKQLGGFMLKRAAGEERAIRDYVESQAHGETVVHLEKVATEHLRERRLDAWDVRTNRCRYWVITNPTNLYLQKDFRSLDFLISFHIGLMTRVFARREPGVSAEEEHRLAAAFRRWTQAAEALDAADEADAFQAVGVRCREALLALVRAVADDKLVPAGEQAPKRGDFIHWAELIAGAIASGPGAGEVRGHLRAVSRSAWQLVAWLVHASGATFPEAELAVEATSHVLSAFSAALVRYERGAPERCPSCSSYRLGSVRHVEGGAFITACAACGWMPPTSKAG